MEEDDKTKQIWHLYVHLETFNQEQTQVALQNLLVRNLEDANWQLAHTARLRQTITDDQVYMSAQKSITIRFYTHSAKKQAEGTALIDSDATENFMSLNYAQWLGLPIKHLDHLLRRVFYCEWHGVWLTVYCTGCTHISLNSLDCVVTTNMLTLTGYVFWNTIWLNL